MGVDMGFKITDTQPSIYGQSPPHISVRIDPKIDSFSHNDVALAKKNSANNKSCKNANVDLKSLNPIIELLRRTLSTIRYGYSNKHK